jgi:hypothetical protein
MRQQQAAGARLLRRVSGLAQLRAQALAGARVAGIGQRREWRGVAGGGQALGLLVGRIVAGVHWTDTAGAG